MSYSEKLKHPKWQRRRLEILERDRFECQLCGDTETTLHIHHKVYRPGHIWDYENNELVTYCESCHSIVEWNKCMNPDDIIMSVLKGKYCRYMYAKSKWLDGSLHIMVFTKDIKFVSWYEMEGIKDISLWINKII